MRELWDAIARADPEPLCRVGRCVPYGHTSAYQPLGEILREHFAFTDDDPPEGVLKDLVGREVLALALGLDVTGGVHPLAVREQFRQAWRSFLAELASERPTVLLIEDLHWAENALLELLVDSREVCGPLLVLATTRPEGAVVEGGETLHVEPLVETDGERLLTELLGAEPSPALQPLISRAEGNPYFVEEIVSTLVDRGLLVPANGSWTLEDLPPDFALPDSVRALLAARIDLLPSLENAAVQAGAVIGRAFWKGAVQTLVGEEPDF